MYVIAWKSKITEASGRGTTPFTKADADSLCQQRNKKYPELSHWAEPAS